MQGVFERCVCRVCLKGVFERCVCKVCLRVFLFF